MAAVAVGPQLGLQHRQTVSVRMFSYATGQQQPEPHSCVLPPYLGVQAGHLRPQLSVALLGHRGLKGSAWQERGGEQILIEHCH